VILDPQEHAAAAIARELPDLNGVEDVSQMQVPGWGRGETGEWGQVLFFSMPTTAVVDLLRNKT